MYIHVCSIRLSLHTSHSGHTCTETTVQLGSLQYLVPVLEYGDTSIIKICQYSCSIYVGQYTANLNTNNNYFMLYMSAFFLIPLPLIHNYSNYTVPTVVCVSSTRIYLNYTLFCTWNGQEITTLS